MHRVYRLAIAVAGIMWVSPPPSLPATSPPPLSPALPPLSPPAARSVISLDGDWQLYPLPDFQLWPSEPRVTPDQIAQLVCPPPGQGWQPVRVPDDYVVRGDFAPEPNGSLLARGAVCVYGGRECEIPSGSPTPGGPTPPGGSPPPARTAVLNAAGRNQYGGHGYLPLYPAWYQRTFVIPPSAEGKSVWLDFEGVYRDAVVFVNDQFVDQHPSGYTGFRLNITSRVRPGAVNRIALFVDPRWFEGWFYEGGGIYRHVRLILTDPLQIAPWGTFVSAEVPGPIQHSPIQHNPIQQGSPQRNGSPTGDRAAARLTISTTVRNDRPTARKFTLVSRVLDSRGLAVAAALTNVQLEPAKEATFTQHIALPDAMLWSLEHPNLYRLATIVRVGQTTIDEDETTFGVRTTRFDPEHGFFLNGQHIEIHGVCNHQDFPGVGIAASDNLWSWRIQKLKDMGANAWRCAHNPAAEAFYRAADSMGLLVMDENRHLGDTYRQKADDTTPFDDLSDVKAMVLQHRNHPSIIMWSMANEEGQQRTAHGAGIFAAMKAAVQKIDPTRPTTSAMNGGFTKEGFLSVEDLLGVNYHSGEFEKMHAEFPALMIFGSEDVNAKTSRGTRESSRETGLCSAYGDADVGGQPWQSWIPVVEHPFVAGQFVWTGFDYRGEPNPFSWPAVTSQVGVMDLCGFRKPVYYYWKAAWDQKPSVYLFPDWNAPETMAGKPVRVRVFSNCDRVELLLNGKSLGTQEMPRHSHLDWDVPYAPGQLTAIGYNQGREAARNTVQTSGAAAALRLIPQVQRLLANGEDVAPIEVEVVDPQGRVVGNADTLIHFSVSGNGTIAGVANGNPASHESNVATERQAFRGLCMVLVRATGRPGVITVRAQATGLTAAQVAVTTAVVPGARP